MKEANYIIIGAGISGLCLHHYLEDKDTLIFDDQCGAYKIGESIIPRFFNHPDMDAILEKARRLPSSSPKIGTFIINDDIVASYPLGEFAATQAMHVGRMDLDNLLRNEWQIPVIAERVLKVDMQQKLVYTQNEVYRFRKQIIDCSGSKHFLSKNQNTEQNLWPASALWCYYDIIENDCERFWKKLKSSGKTYKRYELGEKQAESREVDVNYPAKVTTITRVDDGVWMWQIPLYNEKILSVGIVSKNRIIGKRDFLNYVEKYSICNFTIRRKTGDKKNPYHRFHAKTNFARHARMASTEEYILAGDSFSFADPVYSVGTAMAIREAREIAILLNDGGWNKAKSQNYNKMMDSVFQHTIKAFNFWYNETVLTDEVIARQIQKEILHGDLFETGFREVYETVLEDARIEINVANFKNNFYLNQKIGGWRLDQILYRRHRVELSFHKGDQHITIFIDKKADSAKYYLKTDEYHISYHSDQFGEEQEQLLIKVRELLEMAEKENQERLIGV